MVGDSALVGLVEDSDEDHVAFARTVQREAPGVQLVRWASAEACLEALADDATVRPDVLVLDLNLPGADGAELVQRLRSTSVTSELPAFVLSGSERQQDVDRCYAAGANAYLTKPGSATELRALVRMLFRTTTAFRAPTATARTTVAPSPSTPDQRVIDAEREAYEAELRAERDRERAARSRAEALQRLTARLANAGDHQEVERVLIEALSARPSRPTARISASTSETAAQGAMFMPDPFGAGTIALLPLHGHGGLHYGTLRVQTADELDDETEAFLHAAASLTSQALARTGRINELAQRARTGAPDLPATDWWNAAIDAAFARSRASGGPLSLVVVLPADLDAFDADHGPVQGDERILAIIDAWREAGIDLVSPSGAERWVAIIEGPRANADALAEQVRATLGSPPAFVSGSAQWDRREDAEQLLFRAATAIARDPTL